MAFGCQAAWWHGAVAVELLGGECLGLGLVLPGECAGIVWSSSCLAAGQTEIVGSNGASLALFGCLAVWWLGELFLRGPCGWSALWVKALKAWVVKLLGGLSASVVHKEF